MTEERYKELCSQEEELMTQLARVKKQIREYKSSTTFVKKAVKLCKKELTWS